MYELRQAQNERLGLYCYGSEDNPRAWSLWREADDSQLTPWLDLGPDGMIWAIWKHGDEYMLVLEQRDDAASPPVLRQAMMHWPSGRRTDFIFAGDRSSSTQVGIQCVIGLDDDEVLLEAYPQDFFECDGERKPVGAALYDRNCRQLIGHCLRYVAADYKRAHCVTVSVIRADLRDGCGVFNYRDERFIVPADYDRLWLHRGRWLCHKGKGSDFYDEQGVLLASYPYTLLPSDDDDKLYVERDGLWGWADHEGRIIVEPFARDIDCLDAEPKRFARLSLSTTAASPFSLEPAILAALIEATGEQGMSIKYEGVDRAEGGDGMLDVGPAELPGGAAGLFLEDRWGEGRYVVLTEHWRKQVPGTVLFLQGGTRVKTVGEDEADARFLLDVFAQSLEMD